MWTVIGFPLASRSVAQPLTTVAVACSIVPVMPSGPGAAQRFGDPSSVTRNVVASQALLLAAPEPMRKLRRSPRSTGTCGSVNGVRLPPFAIVVGPQTRSEFR